MADAITYSWYNNSAEERFEELRDLACSLEGQDAFKDSGVSFYDLLDVTNTLHYHANEKFHAIEHFFSKHAYIIDSKKKIIKAIFCDYKVSVSKKDLNKAIARLGASNQLCVHGKTGCLLYSYYLNINWDNHLYNPSVLKAL